MKVVAGALAFALMLGAAGCGSGSSAGPASQPAKPPQATHHATRHVVRDYPKLRAGQSGRVRSPAQHASLRLSASRPTTSTTRLSSSYGDAPARGHYVTFRITVADTGSVPVDVRRLDFYTNTQGADHTTTNDGNAPYSGAGSQLDTTEILPRQQISGDLTVDVAHPHGTLFYAPGGHIAIAWRF